MSYPLLSMNPFQNPTLPNTLVNIKPQYEAFDDSIDMPKITPLNVEPVFNEIKFNVDNNNTNKYFQNVNTYIDHPNIQIPNIPTSTYLKKEDNNDKPQWDMITQIYIGSITVVGLFVVFRIMQKTK
jgi:hypothetical protein